MSKRHCKRRGLTINGVHYENVSDHPGLMEWFDCEKNNGLDPETVPIRSMERIWMKCPKCKHSIFISPYSKLKDGKVKICISCGLNREVNNFDHRNSFGKVYPEYVQYWDYEKNKDTPFDITFGSNEQRWFKCRVCGTSHRKEVWTFPKMFGCSKCVHQLHTSLGEQSLFYYIQKCIPDAINGDRSIISPLEIDIFVPETNPTGTKIAIEYCGSTWHERVYEKMSRKYEMCKSLGIRLLVVWEKKPTESVPSDLGKYSDWFTSNNTMRFTELMNRSIVDTCNEIGIHPDVNVERDRDIIMKRMYTYSVFDSVADDPEMERLWIYEKNPVSPRTVYRDSHSKFWFRCPKCGSERYVPCYSAHHFKGCPACSLGRKRTVMMTEDGLTLLRTWNSAREASQEMKLDYTSVARACNGGYYGKHVFHGYYWKYE